MASVVEHGCSPEPENNSLCASSSCTEESEAMDVTSNGETTQGSPGDERNLQPPTVEVQKTTISHLSKTAMEVGDNWFVLDVRWLEKWKTYVGYDDGLYSSPVGYGTDSPGPIDNSHICENGVLRSKLVCDIQYSLVPQGAWENLVAWYGIGDSVSPLPRHVVEVGTLRAKIVEVYRPELKLCEQDCETLVCKNFSRADTLAEVCKVAKEVFQYPADSQCRLWTFLSDYHLVRDMSATLDEADLQSGDRVMIERQQPDGKWPRTPEVEVSSASSGNSSAGSGNTVSQPRSTYSSGYSSSYYSSNYSWSSNNRSSPPGLCGLSNLGNTCFMNSALQCMSNTRLLSQYLLADKHVDEINTDNPLGMQGQIAHAYTHLLKDMWSGNNSSVSPREFKHTVSRFAPQFSGYAQHDSQELLAFLLDGLHEDLNRIRKKPYVELKDSSGRADEDVATEAWDAHRRRNDSVIVDMFQGQFKSRLVCPTCSKVSVTFDPFMFLSLPLPVKKTRVIEVTLVFLDPMTHPKAFMLTVPKGGRVMDMLRELAKKSGINFDQLACADVYHHRFHKIFSVNDSLSHILERDVIFAYEIEEVAEEDDTVTLPVYHREPDLMPRSSYNVYHSQPSFSLFGFPFFVTVPRRATTYQALHEKVMHQLSRFVKPGKCTAKPALSAIVEKSDDMKNGSERTSLADDDADEINGQREDVPHSNSQNGNDAPPAYEDIVNSTDQSVKGTCNGSIANDGDGAVPVELFSVSTVNSYGGTASLVLRDDGSHLQLSEHTYLGLDWNEDMKKLAYDEEEADRCDAHETPVEDSVPKKIQLTDCLKLFTTEEQLGEDDPWYCPECKEHRQAMKKFDIWKLPKVLVIHLKRFSYNRYWRDKLDTMVHFPTENLDLTPFCLDPNPNYKAVYDLHAVSNHFGGMGGGHYTAFAKHHSKEKWYDFDDSSVSAVSDDDGIVSHSAYVLFYTRRDAAEESVSNEGSGTSDSNEGSSASDSCSASSEATLREKTNSFMSEDVAMEDEESADV